jgi:beta-lactamase regulating signal transducer with metallopeptidase domain
VIGEELRNVLAHELAHIRRHDIALRWLGITLGVIWWFHPILPVLQRRMRGVSEECCDDLAVSLPGVTISGYRRALVMVAELASRRRYVWATTMSDEAETLRDRIARLATPPSQRVARWQVILMMILAALLLPGVRISAGRLVPRIEIRHVEAGSVSDDHQSRHAARHQHSH